MFDVEFREDGDAFGWEGGPSFGGGRLASRARFFLRIVRVYRNVVGRPVLHGDGEERGYTQHYIIYFTFGHGQGDAKGSLMTIGGWNCFLFLLVRCRRPNVVLEL